MWSDRTEHDAVSVGSGWWRVSWLPGRLVSQGEAVTALMLAETLTSRPLSWVSRLVVRSLAAELGLTANQAADLTVVHRPGGPSGKNARQAGPSSTDESEGSAPMVSTTNPDCLALGCDWDWDSEWCVCGASRVFRICARCLVADDSVCEACDETGESGPEVAA